MANNRHFLSHIIIWLMILLAGCESSTLTEIGDPNKAIAIHVSQPSYLSITVQNTNNVIVAMENLPEPYVGRYYFSFNTKDLPEGIYFITVYAQEVTTGKSVTSTQTLYLRKWHG